MLEDDYFSVTQLAEYLGVTRQYAGRLVKLKKITAEKVGTVWMIKKKQVEKFMQNWKKRNKFDEN